MLFLNGSVQNLKKENKALLNKQAKLWKQTKENEENILFLNETVTYLWKKLEESIPGIKLDIKDTSIK